MAEVLAENPSIQKPWPVLLLSQELGQGGTERQTVEFAKGLDRSRFSVHVGCFYSDGFRSTELISLGIPILQLSIPRWPSFWMAGGAWRLVRYIRRHRIRLVHTFDTPMNCFAAPIARTFGVPVVLSSQRASRDLTLRWERAVLRLTDRLADAVIVNCGAVRRHLIDDEGVRPEQLRLCHNGLDTVRFRLLTKHRPPPLSDASLVVGVVCALRAEKGLPTLLQAFASVLAGAPVSWRSGLRLAVIGSGPMRAPLESLTVQLGIRDRCHFEPSTPHVEVWLQAIDIFVLPSLSEALSNALMEAMACGCAVVASRVGGNPELVSEGVTGFTFEPGDATALADRIEKLAANEELRSRLGAAAADFVRRGFSLEQSARRMEEIYMDFLEPGHRL